jgi:hypothetical protein
MSAPAFAAPATRRRRAAPTTDHDVLTIALAKVHMLLDLIAHGDQDPITMSGLASIAVDDLERAQEIAEALPRTIRRRGGA